MNYTISGYIRDKASAELLIGSTVFIKETGTGAQANVYGFYSITLPQGKYTLEYRSVGYASQIVSVELIKNEEINIDLSSDEVELRGIR
ncbi:MAG: carboxypeptidase-like regulatory domain-containing protein [Cyclobacteriaceae bacterium]|nr:carboxypeptidase-like regulatory domain-containing protein [Cyclobacteriaceae bacterium]